MNVQNPENFATRLTIDGIEYPPGQVYSPPDEDVCRFLSDTFVLIGDKERYEQRDLANRLIKIHSGKLDPKITVKVLLDAFTWMYQAGVLMKEWKRWRDNNIQVRLKLWRCVEPSEVRRVMIERPTILDGKVYKVEAKTPDASTSKKKCCDNPKIVKSKSTGERRCKNCGKKKKKKKKKA